ncbi:MAG: LPS export ABC transporter periplasmic protein LptC [Gammaproteobacteria bacterium]|nr:LPS export ABC transporter periplasmic protein LptC [Gammaproteobacteria bacterium]
MRFRQEARFWSLLGGAALLAVLANESLQRPLPIAPPRLHGADHSFTQPHAWLFDREGRIAYEALGTRLEHRAESGAYLLSEAEVLVHPREGEQGIWRLCAEQARLDDDRRHAWLVGAVTIEREQVAPADALRLQARDVVLDLTARTAQSQQPMTAEGLHWQSQAAAFSADFTQQLLLQEGRVHDRHEPLRR